MQEDKIRILSTRWLDEAATAKTNDDHIDIDAVSFINVQPVYSPELKTTLQALATQSICAVFTSANAVTPVAEQVNSQVNWRIFCTGGRTKEYIINAFGEDTIIASSKNAGLLAERIIASRDITKVIFFCGDQRLNDLPEKLKAANMQIEEVVVYTTVPTPVFVEQNYHAILFFSPSAAHSFFSINTLPTGVVLFSIGQTTTAAIQSYCTNKIITSEWPAAGHLLQIVADFYNTASAQTK